MSHPEIPLRRAQAESHRFAMLRPLMRAAVECFVRIVGRCGFTREEIVATVGEACERVPRTWAGRARRLKQEISEASHVLTIWFNDAAYLDDQGKPRPLPFDGASSSVAALIRSVDRQLDPQEVVAYLLRSGALRRTGVQYVPRTRGVVLRGVRGPDYFRTFRVLNNFLGTLAHNLQPKRNVPPRYERFVENKNFPVRELEALDTFLHDQGEDTLTRIDAYMHQRAKLRQPGEPTVHVVYGMYAFEELLAPPHVEATPRQ